jgi:hypothetical protein
MALFDKVLAGSAAGGSAVAAGVDRMLQTLPGFAAAMGAYSASKPVDAGNHPQNEMATRINESDTQHMNDFPAEQKAHVMEKIMSRTPLTSEQCMESHHYEKTMMRLHSEGYRLIDLQPLETALTTVWYRQGRSMPWHKRADVKMVVWETEPSGETTTVMTWRI